MNDINISNAAFLLHTHNDKYRQTLGAPLLSSTVDLYRGRKKNALRFLTL